MADQKYYRIGDFAKKLGVTPDFLKYCEKKGLITSSQQENGYRYYDFSQSATVLEYIKLKNQGFSAEEANRILHTGSFREFAGHEFMLEHQLAKQMNYLRALRQYVSEIREIQDFFTDPPRWNLRKLPAFYFFPHTIDDRLLEGDQYTERIPQWTSWMPVICSASRLGWLEKAEQPVHWGFAAFESFARQQELDTSFPVELVPARTNLEIFITEDLSTASSRYIDHAMTLLTRLNLRQTQEAFSFTLAKLWDGEKRKGYSILCIPAEERHERRP